MMGMSWECLKNGAIIINLPVCGHPTMSKMEGFSSQMLANSMENTHG
jgi:hypothetical protein